MHTISIFVDQNRMPKLASYFECHSYFIATTGSVSLETVKQYIESQRSEEHQAKNEVSSP